MAEFVSCNDKTFDRMKRKVELITLLVQQYRWIIEAYVSDFYTHDHWSKLSHCIKEYFDATNPPDWAWLLAVNKNDSFPCSSKPIPLILLALKTYCDSLSLRRIAVDLDSSETNQNILHSLKKDSTVLSCEKRKDSSHNVNVAAFQPSNYKNGQCMDMQHIFRRHVKPKKQHEIQKLGQAINLLSSTTNCKSVVDVGAGLGHLSRLLTFRFGLKVTTVEADGGHAPKASEFDRELKKDVQKKRLRVDQSETTDDHPTNSSCGNLSSSNETNVSLYQNRTETFIDNASTETQEPFGAEGVLPSHVVCRIGNDIATSQFLDIVKQSRMHCLNDPDEDNFILTGLHACGDLSPSLLRIFLECQSAVGLASVACCYMKVEYMTTDPCDSSKRALNNYPMSSFLNNVPNHELNFESMEMACHFADSYCQRLKDNLAHLKIHSYRAALQYIVISVLPTFQSGQVRLTTKKGVLRPFPDYVAETLKKLNIDISEVPQEMLQHCEEMTNQWKRVVAFYTLRLSLAPVVESLILLDRVLWLKEKGINSILVPIFDSKISPRNFAVLAVKS